MANSRLMTEDELKSWVLRKLGAPRLSIELDKCHLDDFYHDAIDWWTAHIGVTKRKFFTLVRGTPVYAVPEDLDYVVDVYPPGVHQTLAGAIHPVAVVDELAPYDSFAAPESGGTYSTYAQNLQYVDIAAKVLSADFDWMWDEDNRNIIVTPTPRCGGLAAYDYVSHCVELEKLTARDHELIKAYMLAEAKIQLGRIRSRYNGEFLTADGPKQNDGPTLLQEGTEEKRMLDEKIAKLGMPALMIVG